MAPTFLVKALKRISGLAFPNSKSRPSQDTIQLIAHTANGDLRSAINSLQFLSRSGDADNGLKATTTGPRAKASGKGSRGGKGGKVNASEEVKKLYVICDNGDISAGRLFKTDMLIRCVPEVECGS